MLSSASRLLVKARDTPRRRRTGVTAHAGLFAYLTNCTHVCQLEHLASYSQIVALHILQLGMSTCEHGTFAGVLGCLFTLQWLAGRLIDWAHWQKLPLSLVYQKWNFSARTFPIPYYYQHCDTNVLNFSFFSSSSCLIWVMKGLMGHWMLLSSDSLLVHTSALGSVHLISHVIPGAYESLNS